MRRFLRHVRTSAVLLVASSAAQACFTYIPAMNRETDGVYYTPSKDSDRAERARYYTRENERIDRNDLYYYDPDTGEYYLAEQYDEFLEQQPQPVYMTPIEFAYWSTMPSKYRSGGEVKILNTYYNGYLYDPFVPGVNVAVGYGFGGYGSRWSFSLSFGAPAYYYGPYWAWPYDYSYYAYPWRPWRGPYRGWGSPWYGPGYWGWDPWYAPGPWGWNDRFWWYHGYHPGSPGGRPGYRPPAQLPPRRYSGDTAPQYDRRPSSGADRPVGNPGGVRNPSNGARPVQGTSVSTEGYNRRPAGNTGSSSIRVPGQSSPTGNRSGTTTSSGQVRRSGYENIRSGSSSATPSSSRRGTYRAPASNSGSTRSYSRTSNTNNASSSRSYSSPGGNSSSSTSSSQAGSAGAASSGSSSSGYSRR